MCLIIFGYKAHTNFPLIVAANRDEIYDRPSVSSHFWSDNPKILAGMDLLGKGTWMGISKEGRFAAVTNGRGAPTSSKNKQSRGLLTVDFLNEQISAEDYASAVKTRSSNFNNFHLLIYDQKSMWYIGYNSIKNDIDSKELNSGIYGLSNAGINSEWPKCEIGKEKMSKLIATDNFKFSDLQQVVSGCEPAPKSQLQKLGLCEENDSLFSAQFVSGDIYGTRCSTLLTIHSQGIVKWLEINFDSSSKINGGTEKIFNLTINSNKKMQDK